MFDAKGARGYADDAGYAIRMVRDEIDEAETMIDALDEQVAALKERIAELESELEAE